MHELTKERLNIMYYNHMQTLFHSKEMFEKWLDDMIREGQIIQAIDGKLYLPD